jgi:hypothetical protein
VGVSGRGVARGGLGAGGGAGGGGCGDGGGVFRMLLHCGCDYQLMYSQDGIQWVKQGAQRTAGWCSGVNYTDGGGPKELINPAAPEVDRGRERGSHTPEHGREPRGQQRDRAHVDHGGQACKQGAGARSEANW